MFQRLSLRTFGRPQTLPGRVRLPLAAGFGTMGCFLPAFNPDVWPPSNASRRGTVATGSARGFKTWLFTVSGRLWHNGLRFNGFHSGRLAALKPFPAWLFTVSGRLRHNGLCFNACHSGRLAALKPSPAGYGCHWLQALAQWAVFYRLSIRTFGRPQKLPGGVRLPLALLGLQNLAFHRFRQALAQWAAF